MESVAKKDQTCWNCAFDGDSSQEHCNGMGNDCGWAESGQSVRDRADAIIASLKADAAPQRKMSTTYGPCPECDKRESIILGGEYPWCFVMKCAAGHRWTYTFPQFPQEGDPQ